MPYVKRKNKKTKSRPRRKNGSRSYRLVSSRSRRMPISSMLPISRSRIVSHRYVHNINIATGASVNSHIFRANSVYDPDYSVGVGSRTAQFYDQMRTMYYKSCVLGAKITVHFSTQSTTATSSPNVVALKLDNDVTYTSDLTELLQQGNITYRTLDVSQGKGSCTLKKYFSHRREKGSDPTVDTDSCSNGNANPNHLFYLHVMTCAQDETTNTADVYALVTIDYIVKWSEPIDISQGSAF